MAVKHPKIPFIVLGLEFGKGGTFFYKCPDSTPVSLGQRAVVKNKASFSIPTVVGIYAAEGPNSAQATDWVVQVVDTTTYDECVLGDLEIDEQ